MIGLLGKKVGMTQIFKEDGRRVPVTVLQVGPCQVTALRTKDKHGYSAVQLGFDPVPERKLTKPELGQLKKSGNPSLRFIREIRTEEVEGLKVGQQLKSDQFEAGDYVDIEGISIGHGFQGVIKRHHFKGPATWSHGQKAGARPGSIGASSFPSRVVKGMRAPGHMGNRNVTIQNLQVVTVDHENDLVALKGTVPGFEGRYVVIRKALKRGPSKKWKVQATPEVPEEKKS